MVLAWFQSMVPLLLSLLLTSTPALAARSSDVQQSEYHRLSGEMRSLCRRQAWQGVDRTYRALVATGVEPSALDHVRGADAARALGDIASARERLLASVRLQVHRDAIEELYRIDTELGRVALAGEGLSAEAPPWLPEHRAAVAFAAERLAEEGRFVGFLPPGAYRLGDHRIEVVAGESLTIEADPDDRPRRRRRSAPTG